MTAQLYVRDGSRFVPADQFDTGPLPLLERPSLAELSAPREADPMTPTADRPVIETTPGHYRVYAPRCPHGSFARWAVRNCCSPTPAVHRRTR